MCRIHCRGACRRPTCPGAQARQQAERSEIAQRPGSPGHHRRGKGKAAASSARAQPLGAAPHLEHVAVGVLQPSGAVHLAILDGAGVHGGRKQQQQLCGGEARVGVQGSRTTEGRWRGAMDILTTKGASVAMISYAKEATETYSYVPLRAAGCPPRAGCSRPLVRAVPGYRSLCASASRGTSGASWAAAAAPPAGREVKETALVCSERRAGWATRMGTSGWR
jgi:hypothetical protein